MLKKTRVFRCGNSLAVRLPKEFRIDVSEVYIKREGSRIVIIPSEEKWDDLFARLEEEKELLQDFLAERKQPPAQEREVF